MAAGTGIRTTKRPTGATVHPLTAGGIVLVYAAVGIAWIVTSDAILSWLTPHGGTSSTSTSSPARSAMQKGR
jgi:hypothetical protein